MAVEESRGGLLVALLGNFKAAIDSPNRDVLGHSTVLPELDQAPVQWRYDQILAAEANKMLFNLREVVEVVPWTSALGQYSTMISHGHPTELPSSLLLNLHVPRCFSLLW
jgi:hypothetical protein